MEFLQAFTVIAGLQAYREITQYTEAVGLGWWYERERERDRQRQREIGRQRDTKKERQRQTDYLEIDSPVFHGRNRMIRKKSIGAFTQPT